LVTSPIWGTGVVWFILWLVIELGDRKDRRKRARQRRGRGPDRAAVRTAQQTSRSEPIRHGAPAPREPRLVRPPRQISWTAVSAIGGLLSGIAAMLALFIGK
jgi:hypothetical protein